MTVRLIKPAFSGKSVQAEIRVMLVEPPHAAISWNESSRMRFLFAWREFSTVLGR
jgi:hypothetical protein